MTVAAKVAGASAASALLVLGAYALGSLGHIGTPHHALHVALGTLGGVLILWACALAIAVFEQ